MKKAIVSGSLVGIKELKKRNWLGLFPQTLVSYKCNFVGVDGINQYSNINVKWVSDKNIFVNEEISHD